MHSVTLFLFLFKSPTGENSQLKDVARYRLSQLLFDMQSSCVHVDMMASASDIINNTLHVGIFLCDYNG